MEGPIVNTAWGGGCGMGKAEWGCLIKMVHESTHFLLAYWFLLGLVYKVKSMYACKPALQISSLFPAIYV